MNGQPKKYSFLESIANVVSGRRFRVQEWKVGEERNKCFSCFVKDKFIKEAFKDLTPREQKILDTRFGITDGVSRTLEETGKIFGVTRERIRQIEAKAMVKLEEFKRSSKHK